MDSDLKLFLSGSTTAGVIYALYNTAYPDLLKIGFSKDEAEYRSARIYHGDTGVPMHFQIFDTAIVYDCKLVESLVHKTFSDRRINDDREFFGEETPFHELFDMDKTIARRQRTSTLHDDVKRIFNIIRAATGEKEIERVKETKKKILYEKGICRYCSVKCGKTNSQCDKGRGCRRSEINYCSCGKLAAQNGRNTHCKDCRPKEN